jgi:hypothetical protein
VNSNLDAKKAHPGVTGGENAAASLIDLMKKSVAMLPPLDVIDAFNEVEGRNRLGNMFNKLGNRTIDCITDGCLCLAKLWESAWKEGNGDQIPNAKLVSIDLLSLKDLYEDKFFLEAFKLTDRGYIDALE